MVRPMTGNQWALSDLDDALSVGDIIARTGMARRSVYAEIEAGRLESVRLTRRRIRIPRKAFAAWCAERGIAAD
jgi:excisionase family DNA binding protein